MSRYSDLISGRRNGSGITAIILGIIWMDLLPTCTLYIMITYLTDVWELNLTHAATIINSYVGISAILTAFMGMKCFADAYHEEVNTLLMISFSGVAYIAGFVFLTLSASVGGTAQKALFYTALPLTALGVFGQKLMLNFFYGKREPSGYHSPIGACCGLLGMVAVIILCVAPPIALALLDGSKGWSLKFGISIIFAVVQVPVFCCGAPTMVVEERGSSPHITRNETRTILLNMPICIFFILMGVVSSLGKTYFIEQAYHLDRYLVTPDETTTYYLFLLPALYLFVKAIFREISNMYACCNILPSFGISLSMVFAALCCITAAKVETRRLGVVKANGLIDKPEATVPMSIGWMYPQFILLGIADGLFENCIARFITEDVLHCSNVPNRTRFSNEAAEKEYRLQKLKEKSLRHYTRFFASAVSGVGSLFSVLLVYVVGEIKPTWFQDTLNKSRLDNYYWTLSALTAANLVLYILVSCCWYLVSIIISNSQLESSEDTIPYVQVPHQPDIQSVDNQPPPQGQNITTA